MTDPDPDPVYHAIHLDEHRIWLQPDDEPDDDDTDRHPAARKHWT